MGSLAGCFKRLGIEGAEADYIRSTIKAYREDGMAGPEANVKGIGDLINDLTEERQSVLEQIYAQAPELKPQEKVPTPPAEKLPAPPTVTVDPQRFEPIHLEPVFMVNPSPDAAWQSTAPGRLDKVIRVMQDKNVDLKQIVEAMQKAGIEVPDELNPVYREEMFHKRAQQRTDDFDNKELRPLIDLMKKHGIELKQLDEYAHARHVLNDHLNARLQDLNPDLEGKPEFEKLAGISDQEAREILAKYDDKPMGDLMSRVDAMVEKTRNLMVEYGLESQERIDNWRKQYRSYVPLHREGFEEEGNPTGTGYSVRGSSVKDRLGSALKVTNVIANIAQARDQVISRGEKMRPVTALAGLLLKYPNHEFAKLDKYSPIEYTDPSTGLTERVPGDVGGYQRPMIRRRVPASLEDYLDSKGMTEQDLETMGRKELQDFRKQYRAWSLSHSTVKFFPDPTYKGRPNVVNFRVKGKDYAIIFNEDDARALETAKGLKNLDTVQLNVIVKAIAPFTRYLASINTQYNPIFGVVNFIRDVQFASLTLASTELAGKQREIMANVKSAWVGVYKDARASRNGQELNSPEAELWRRFEHVGGPTGYRDLFFSSTDRAQELERLLSPSGFGKIRSPQQFMKAVEGTAVFKWLSDYNLAMENSIRLAVFKTGIESGLSDLKAASLAKNITVNFNKKGQVGAQMGALYAFFNANIQGTARIAETLFQRTPDGGARLSSVGKQIVFGGLMLGVAQSFALMAAGFEDDEPPEFVKQRNLVIPTFQSDKGYLQIPLPLGFNLLPTAGRLAAETVSQFLRGQPPKAMDRGAKFMEAMINTFSPLGGSVNLLQELAPTILDTPVALSQNVDWTGKQIYQEDISKVRQTPGHSRAKDSATIWAVGISKALNWATGGSDYTPGSVSPSPDAIDYLVGQAGGGVLREFSKLAQLGRGMISGEEVPEHKIPLLGRFYGTSGGSTGTRDRFYDNIRDVNRHALEVEGRAKDGGDFSSYAKEHPEYQLRTTALRFQKEIGRLRDDKERLIDSGAPKEQVKQREQQISNVMKMFNDQVDRLKGIDTAK